MINPLTCPASDLPRIAAELMGWIEQKDGRFFNKRTGTYWRVNAIGYSTSPIFNPCKYHDHAHIVVDVIPTDHRCVFISILEEVLECRFCPECGRPPSEDVVFATPQQKTRAACAALQELAFNQESK